MTRRVGAALYPHEWILYRAIGPLPGVRIPDGEFRIGRLPDLQQIRTRDMPLDFFADEVYGAKLAWVVLAGPRIAAVVWGKTAACPGNFIRFTSDQAELGYGYTLPEFRGRGLLRWLLTTACRDLANEGYPQVLAIIRADNIAPQKAVAACGFREVARTFRPVMIGRRLSAPPSSI